MMGQRQQTPGPARLTMEGRRGPRGQEVKSKQAADRQASRK